MSLESEITRISNAKADIKTAIEQKGVDVSDEARIDAYADYVNQIGAEEEEFTVRFYDFDGTITAQYTRSGFLNLTALPPNPTHAGLTAQGWNWSLADAKAYVAEFGGLDIGQMYCTTDGKTKLYITISDRGLLTLPFYWTQTVASGVTINWGDGNSESFSGVGNHNTTHTYSAVGDYVITITVNSGLFSLGNGASGTTIFKGGNAYYATKNMLKKVEFGTGITAINAYAFYQYYNMEYVTFSNNIKLFGNSSFYGCYNLMQVTIPSGVTAINAASCFSSCYCMVSISIPNTVKTIGYLSFQSDYALTSLSIPTSVTSVGGSVVGWSYNVKDFRSPIVTSNTSYVYIGKPWELETMDIPNGVTTVAAYAFQNCVQLKSVTIPNSVTTFGTSAFDYCYNLKSLTVPDGVKVIPAQFCRYCYALKELNLPNTITATTANYSFAYCYSLDTVVLPSSLKTIAGYSFYYCLALSHITIPSEVTTISSYAFRYCYSLKSIYMMPTTPPALTSNAFSDIGTEYKIYVPAASLDTYKTATNWSAHADHILAMP